MKNIVLLLLALSLNCFGAGNSQIITAQSPLTLTNGVLAIPASPPFTNLLLSGYLQGAEIATPSNPTGTNHRLYFKSDGLLYTLDSAGDEVVIGGGQSNYMTGTLRVGADSNALLGAVAGSSQAVNNTIVAASTTSGGIVSVGAYLNDGTRNKRVGLFADDTNGSIGIAYSASSGVPKFVIANSFNVTTPFQISGTDAVTIGSAGGSQIHAVNGSLVVTASSGPMLTVTDGGTFGTNADPSISFNDSVGSGGTVGFFNSAAQDFYVRNTRATGSLLLQTNSTTGLSVNSSQKVDIGASGGTQTHRANGSLYVDTGLEIGSGASGVSNANVIIYARKDQDAKTRQILTNGNTGASSRAMISLSTVDDFDWIANSSGAGSSGSLMTGSGFTGGFTIGTFGAHTYRVRTSNTDRMTFSGTGEVVIPAASGNNLRIGVSSNISSTNERLSVRYSVNSTEATQQTTNAYFNYINANDAAQTSTQSTSRFDTQRNITTSQTDTAGNYGSVYGFAYNVGTGATLTGTEHVSLYVSSPSNSGSGTLALTSLGGIRIDTSSLATGTSKYGLYVGNQSGATNNASITNNLTYSGGWFINSTSTSESLLSGPLTVSMSGANQTLVGYTANTSNITQSTTGTYYTVGFSANSNAPIISTGVTNSGYYYGANLYALRANASDAGTLSGNLTASNLIFGHYSTAGAAASSTAAIGLDITPYFQAGTITNAYGVYVRSPQTGGTATTMYGLKIDNQTAAGTNWGINTGSGKNLLGDNTAINGQVAIGTTTTDSGYGLRVLSTNLSGTTQIAVGAQPTFTSEATSAMIGFTSSLTTAAASYATHHMYGFYAPPVTIGAGNTVTYSAKFIGSSSGGATNNVVLTDNISFTGNYFLNSNSGDPSNLAGQLQLANGSAAAPSHSFSGNTGTGFYRGTGGSGNQFIISVNGAVQAGFDADYTSYNTASSTSSYDLLRAVSTGSMRLYGGVGSASGNIQIFGSGHATKAGYVEIGNNAGTALAIKGGLVVTTQSLALGENSTVTLTADNQSVSTTGKSLIYLGSDDATAANRTFTLTAGVGGQVLVLVWTHASNLGELIDTGAMMLSANWTPNVNDTLSLVSDGTNWRETGRSSSSVTPTELGYLSGVGSSLAVEGMSGDIGTAANATYPLITYHPYAATINTVYLKTASGTITAKLQINGSDVTGCTAISVTSTRSATTCTAANAMVAGDVLTMVTSSNSTALDLSFTVKMAR